MIYNIECSCGVHKSVNENVFILKNGISDIVNNIKDYIKAGSICVVYAGEDGLYAENLRSALIKERYNASTIDMNNADIDENFLDNLLSNYDFIIGIGGEKNAKILSSNRCLFIVNNLLKTNIFNYSFRVVFVDKKEILSLPLSILAGSYGRLMIKLLSILDYRFYRLTTQAVECNNLLTYIEKNILNLFEKTYTFYKDNNFLEDLVEVVVQNAIYESMLVDKDLLYSYDLVSENLVDCVSKKICVGEADLLVSWYCFNLLNVLSNGHIDNLFLPQDISEDIESLKCLADSDIYSVLDNIGDIKAKEISTIRYMFDEYKQDIKNYISGIWQTLENAMKNYRRIYYDAGLSIVLSITIEKLSSVVRKSIVEAKYFSLIKMFRIYGDI